ncbi:hypothetical protein CEE37_04965 [candidate division LCP-89 bacterium B3_LCP]|uniref:Secretion system C-terminal sorting domain-containing protein n=1 Tax=candidate division LCP-89 bacterium B3_LCP TaxID=2012998 RepID=A0A532V1H0_UNCL8|nr:MAG: hypothetical protein CEE37_04965 [candidate division LCP-89 bacterium B3_LCP]
MRKLALLLIFAFSLPALAQVDYHKVEVTRWAGSGKPMTYAEYIASHPLEPLRWQEVDRRYSNLDQTGSMLVVVDWVLSTWLQTEIDRYLDDLTADGWDPIQLTMTGGTPEELRGILQQYWASDSIMGATLVGDLPVPWFELYEDFDNDGIPDNPWQVQFTCDLYYMDLDGYWYDGDLDGILDTHLGSWEPDIFIGQIIASTIGNEIDLISNYFDKNHAFRQNQLQLPGLGLAYIDDDWSGSGESWGAALAQATGMVETIFEPNATIASDYLDRLNNDPYYAILLAAHSCPEYHTLCEQSGTVWNEVYYWQVAQADPQSFFYNLFCCSGCSYVAPNYLGGQYIFADSYGQGAVGSTKTGSMLYFEDYYTHIEDGECKGEALRLWLAQHGQEPGSVMWAMSWFYGMTHLGDPTLFMSVGVEITQVEVIDDGTLGSIGDGDGIPDAGETVALSLDIENHETQNFEGVWVILSGYSGFVTWVVDSVYVGTLTGSATTTAEGFLLSINSGTPDATTFNVVAEIHDNASGLWGDTFSLELRAPDLVLVSFDMDEITGNGDPFADPGETWGLQVGVINQGGDESSEAMLAFSSVGPYLMPGTAVGGIAPLLPGEIGTHDPPITVQIAPECPGSYVEAILVTILESGAQPKDRYIAFPVGENHTWTNSIDNPVADLINYAVDEGFHNQWHVSDDRSVSAPYSMKFGHTSSYNYAAHSDGALETPLFRLGNNTTLHFQHWMEAEAAFDGGIVEINTGGNWEAITPVGGYPGTSVSNGSFPGGPAYNGQMDWSEAEFDISMMGAFAKFRFRFGSDGGVQQEGWYIDDLQMDMTGGNTSTLMISLIPESSSIIIPAAGGSFDFNIELTNTGLSPASGDIWCDVILPNGTPYGPVLGPVLDLTLPGNTSLDRDRVQEVPQNAPSGTYSYVAMVGDYPDSVFHQDSFEFEKEGTDGGDNGLDGWHNYGEPFEELLAGENAAPEDFMMYPPYPNPFNPTTVLRYQLQDASLVKLSVYDISGRLVTELVNGWRDAGAHEVVFDPIGAGASHLASGIYFYRLTAGEFSAVGKMVLVK